MEAEKALVLANQRDEILCQESSHKPTRGQVFPEDLSLNVVAVCGVVLPRAVPKEPEQVFILNDKFLPSFVSLFIIDLNF